MEENIFAAPPSGESESGPDQTVPDNRHGARQLALQTLYWEVSSPGDGERALDELTERFALSEPVHHFAERLVHTVGEHVARLDELIAAAATHWKPDRIARLDNLILRLALAEILYFDDVPVRVSIDEAVELAKTYSTDQSYAFINGILDAIVRQQGLPV